MAGVQGIINDINTLFLMILKWSLIRLREMFFSSDEMLCPKTIHWIIHVTQLYSVYWTSHFNLSHKFSHWLYQCSWRSMEPCLLSHLKSCSTELWSSHPPKLCKLEFFVAYCQLCSLFVFQPCAALCYSCSSFQAEFKFRFSKPEIILLLFAAVILNSSGYLMSIYVS